jgi:D-arabinose 1-dehydrogenase-like Zn-dependent alcohol dehydrogenase
VTTRPLAQVNDAMAELRNGTVSGRIVLIPR